MKEKDTITQFGYLQIMKGLFLLAVFWFNCQLATGQHNNMMVLSTNGQTFYSYPDKSISKLPLKAGLQLNTNGKITLKNNSSIQLLFKNHPIQLTNSGTYLLKDLIPEVKTGQTIGFKKDFWQLVNEGLSSADSEQSLEKYYDQVYEAEEAMGFGKSTAGITTKLPLTGKIGEEVIDFEWRTFPGEGVIYKFIINRIYDKKTIFKVLTKDTFYHVDLSTLALKDGEQYYWRISVDRLNDDEDKSGKLSSEKIPFTYQADSQTLVEKRLNKVLEYKQSEKLKKKWMEAIAMEEQGYYYQAYKQYQKLHKENPDNLIIKKLYAAFLTRRGFLTEAKEVLED